MPQLVTWTPNYKLYCCIRGSWEDDTLRPESFPIISICSIVGILICRYFSEVCSFVQLTYITIQHFSLLNIPLQKFIFIPTDIPQARNGQEGSYHVVLWIDPRFFCAIFPYSVPTLSLVPEPNSISSSNSSATSPWLPLLSGATKVQIPKLTSDIPTMKIHQSLPPMTWPSIENAKRAETEEGPMTLAIH